MHCMANSTFKQLCLNLHMTVCINFLLLLLHHVKMVYINGFTHSIKNIRSSLFDILCFETQFSEANFDFLSYSHPKNSRDVFQECILYK